MVAALAVAWAVLAALSLLSANREIRRGLKAMDAARARADAAAVVEGRLLPDLRTARAHFAAGHDAAGGPLLVPARVLPVAGRQLRSVSALSAAATTVTDVAIDGMTEAQPILDEPGGSNAARASSARRLGELAGRADSRLAALRLGPRIGLITPLVEARNRLAGQLDELRGALGKAAKGGGAVADLLQGPRRYLVFAANNAEMRAGSGMLLSAGELETGPDGIRLGTMRSVTDIPIPEGAVALRGDLADRWGWLQPTRDWRNLMTSPRFDVAAPLAAEMWVAAGNRPVDGVMVLDPVALAGLLRATGPVELDGRRLDTDSIVEALLHGQYLRFPNFEERPERREGLGKIAGAIFAVLDRGTWSLPGLAGGLANAAEGRHLLMWAAAAPEQSAWQALGVDGSIRSDSLLLSVLNRGGNKLDPFVKMEAEMTVQAAEGGSDITVTVRLENRAPVGEPLYIVGPHPLSGVGEGVYVGLLTLSTPGAATGVRFDGVDVLAVSGTDGPSQVIGFQFELPRGGTRSVVGRFHLPGERGSMQVEPSARVPPIVWRSGPATWRDSSARTLTWTL